MFFTMRGFLVWCLILPPSRAGEVGTLIERCAPKEASTPTPTDRRCRFTTCPSTRGPIVVIEPSPRSTTRCDGELVPSEIGGGRGSWAHMECRVRYRCAHRGERREGRDCNGEGGIHAAEEALFFRGGWFARGWCGWSGGREEESSDGGRGTVQGSRGGG